jgi:multicomponent Na+:H+ antiporter subunit D
MPFTAALTTVGAASISAFPLFSGFVSKSMVMAALLEEGYMGVWPVLLFASAGVFHHAGIKIPYFAFFAHDSGIRTKEPPWNMIAAMTLAAVLCVGIGTFPQFLYGILPFGPAETNNYWPYDITHVLTQTQLLFFGALAFVGLQKTGIYPPELRSLNIDAEWTYRWLAPRAIRGFAPVFNFLDRAVRSRATRTVRAIQKRAGQIYGPKGLARQWPTGSMVIWVTVMLAAYLIFYFL